LKITYIFIFRTDSMHSGDTEVFKTELISRRQSIQQDFTKWRIHYAQWRPCDSLDTSYKYWLTTDPDYDLENILLTYGRTSSGSVCEDDRSSLCLPTVYVSMGKHGLYFSEPDCAGCGHGGSQENCDGGWEGPSCLGLPGSFGPAGLASAANVGFQSPDDYFAALNGATAGLQDFTAGYLGNIGEHIPDRAFDGLTYHSYATELYLHCWVYYVDGKEPESHNGFSEDLDEGICVLPDSVVNVHDYIEENGLADEQKASRLLVSQCGDYCIGICSGDCRERRNCVPDDENPSCESACASECSVLCDVVRDDHFEKYTLSSSVRGIPDPRYLFFPSDNGQTPLTQVEGCRQNEDLPSYGSLSLGSELLDALPDSGELGIRGIHGMYNYEYIWDMNNDFFCGGQRLGEYGPCQNYALDGVAAGVINDKLSPLDDLFNAELMEHDPTMSQDIDQDGVPDDLDCDPMNPYLTWDIDKDGACDLEVAADLRPYCVAVCQLGVRTDDEISACEWKCSHPDNCSPLSRNTDGAYYPMGTSGTCHDVTLRYNNSMQHLCEERFSNPDQEDLNGNGRGDICEDHISKMYVQNDSGANYGINAGRFAMCPAHTFHVNFTLSRDVTKTEDDNTAPRPVSVGICSCEGNDEGSCYDALQGTIVCPLDAVLYGEEKGKDFHLNSFFNSFSYYYHPVRSTNQDLPSEQYIEQHLPPSIYTVQDGVLRWKDGHFRNHKYTTSYNWKNFTKVPDIPASDGPNLLSYMPAATTDPDFSQENEDISGRYSVLKISAPQPVQFHDPSMDDWQPQYKTLEYAKFGISGDNITIADILCVDVPIPVKAPNDWFTMTDVRIDPLWDPPRDWVDAVVAGITEDENGDYRLYITSPTSNRISHYIQLPSQNAPDYEKSRFMLVKGPSTFLFPESPNESMALLLAFDGQNLYGRSLYAEGAWVELSQTLPAMERVDTFSIDQGKILLGGIREGEFKLTFSTVDLVSGEILRLPSEQAFPHSQALAIAASEEYGNYALISNPGKDASTRSWIYRIDESGVEKAIKLPSHLIRSDIAMIMDPDRGQLYVYGGRYGKTTRNDLWVFDLNTQEGWSLLAEDSLLNAKRPRMVYLRDLGAIRIRDMDDELSMMAEWKNGSFRLSEVPLWQEIE